jgi:predicted glycoside hydrolase/deacetylase ChbG (UPF0249 family)
VASLVGEDGRFRPLGPFLRCLLLGKVRTTELAAELEAQYRRFHDLVGHRPAFVNSHHHVQVFPPVGSVLLDILSQQRPRPYLRRVREPWGMLLAVPGARKKRALLSWLGRRFARQQERAELPGNDWLAGITDPPCLADSEFFVRWLRRIPGWTVELACHPGFLDPTLIGRDCTLHDGMLQRRTRELRLLRHPAFLDAVQDAGFTLATPTELSSLSSRGTADAA